MIRTLLPLLAILALVLCAGLESAPAPLEGRLIVCGGDELYILELGSTPPRKVWSWKAADRPELPPKMRDKFRSIDECKPIDGGKRILITASSDGAAVIEQATGKATFYALVPNAHSIELLPNQRVVVAASHSTTAPGDRLIVYDLAHPDVERFHVEASWAHGVVWDEGRKLLWALSDTELVAYRLARWETTVPGLERDVAYPLPDRGGHDLMPIPGSASLSVSTGLHTWLFDREQRKFRTHPDLGDHPGVKCVHVHPVTGRVVWVLSEGGNWWTDKLRFLNPEGIAQLPNERIYKARWMPDPVR